MDQKEGSTFPSGLPFFGLTQEYRIGVFKQIHEIVFHGKGGYSYETVYNMPIWLRTFTFHSIQETINQLESTSSGNGTQEIDITKPLSPEVKAAVQRQESKTPSYRVKARK